jgi:outer membrane protein insertion porin family
MGVPLTEFTSLAVRYGLNFDDVSLDRDQFFSADPITGVIACDPVLAGRYLCDAIGKRTTSSIGYSLVFDNLNNRLRPSAGQRVIFSQDFAGLGGSVKYIRTRIDADKYWNVGSGFIFSVGLEAGYIKGLGQEVRLTDRFFLGEPQMRGFGIRGVGPRVIRQFYNGPVLDPDSSNETDDALGGNKYYLGRAELEIPLGSGARELGLRPSLFMDAGAVFGVRRPTPTPNPPPGRQRTDSNGNLLFTDPTGAPTTSPTSTSSTGVVTPNNPLRLPPFEETFFGDSAKPRLSIGVGVNWNSPFGPFRIDVAKALLKEPGDQTKLFTFNVGTQF